MRNPLHEIIMPRGYEVFAAQETENPIGCCPTYSEACTVALRASRAGIDNVTIIRDGSDKEGIACVARFLNGKMVFPHPKT